MEAPKELTARDLVDNLMRCFRELDKNRWKLPPPSHSTEYYTCKRVAVLTEAFGIESIADLVHGTFIKRRPPEAYSPIVRAMLSRYDMLWLDERPRDITFGLDISYQHFMTYRSKAQELFRTHDGVLEASGTFAAALQATGELSNQLASQLELIEEWLARVIDPEQRAFRERDLVANHGYPDVDLQQLRIDELWG